MSTQESPHNNNSAEDNSSPENPTQPQENPAIDSQTAQAEAQPEPQATPQPEPQAEPQATAQPEPQAAPQTEPQATPQPEPQAVPQPEPQATPQPEAPATPQPEPQTAPQPEPQALPKADEPSKTPKAPAETKTEAKAKKETEADAKKKSPKKKKLNFKLGQDVVYPLQGVGRITEQNSREFKGDKVDYYTIYISATDMTLMLPIDKVDELGLRTIVPKEDAERALKSMSDKNEPLTSDWKLRYQNNLELLKKGGIMEIATVVRSLYHRSKVKELPILERKLYDNALKLMIDEISIALPRPKEEIEDLLHTRLENSNNP